MIDPDLNEIQQASFIEDLFKEEEIPCDELETTPEFVCVDPVYVEEVELDYFILQENSNPVYYEFVAVDHSRDIGILKPIEKQKTTYVPIDFYKKVYLGEFVVVLGSPASWDDTISFGILAHKRRFVEYFASGTYVYQLSIPITFGSSGSPVFDMNGNVFCLINGGGEPQAAITFCIPLVNTKDFVLKNTYVGKKKIEIDGEVAP